VARFPKSLCSWPHSPALCKGIIERHNGGVWMCPNHGGGGGSDFRLPGSAAENLT